MKKAFLVVPSQQLQKKHLVRSKKRLKKLGYDIEYRDDCMAQGPYNAGTVERRSAELNEAFASGCDAVFCVRGGGGSAEVLPHLNWKKILKSDKPFVGFSDITALHIGLYTQGYKGSLVHGPNSGSFNWVETPEYLELMDRCMNAQPYTIELPKSAQFHKSKSFKGEIIGGNITILNELIGTQFQPSFKGKVVFLEGVFQKDIGIHRKMIQLEMCGMFKGVKALILGRMVDCGDYLPKLTTFIERQKFPVIYEVPIGHEVGMWPIRIGGKVEFNKERNTFSFS